MKIKMKLVHGLNRGDSLETYQQCKDYNEFMKLAKIVNKNELIFTGKYSLESDSLETEIEEIKDYNDFKKLAKIVNKNKLIFTGKYSLVSESEEAIENFANKHNFLKEIIYFSLGVYYFMEENDDLEQISHCLLTLFISLSSQLKLNCDDEEKLYGFIHDASEMQNQLWFNLSQRRITNREEMN